MTSWWTGKKFSEEHRNKLSKAAKGRVGYYKDKHFSKSHCKNISKALKGRKLSDSHRKNVSRGIRNWWRKRRLYSNKGEKSK